MFIRLVDEGLERLLRSELPLPERVGDVTFDAPSSTWAAQLSRLTVNLFLFDIARSAQPVTSSTMRQSDGRVERRHPQPSVALSYLVSAWAGSPRDEHQLLGDAINCVAGHSTLPEQHLPTPPASAVNLAFGVESRDKPREVWTASGGMLKACFTLVATVATDTFDWAEAAVPVDAVDVLADRMGSR